MNEKQEKHAGLELLTLWFEEEFARGRCDAWERYFASNVEVTMPDGRVLATLDDWCAAYARAVKDRPLTGTVATASFAQGSEKAALFWTAEDENGNAVHGTFLAESEAERIVKLLHLESAPKTEASSADDGVLPDGNWWF